VNGAVKSRLRVERDIEKKSEKNSRLAHTLNGHDFHGFRGSCAVGVPFFGFVFAVKSRLSS